MRVYMRGPRPLLCWVCAVTALLVGGWMLCAGRAAAAERPADKPVKVVTAPWAHPSQVAGYSGPQRPVLEPAPLSELAPPPPLSAAERQILKDTLRSEPLAEPTWLRYVVSNEWRHDVIFPRVSNLRGAYLGVATDQNYTVAAAARTELLFLFDYDAEVGRIHRVYHALIDQAESPEAFRKYFEPAQLEAGKAVIDAYWTRQGATKKELAGLSRAYAYYRDRLQVYLRHVANLQVGARRPTWLGDPAAYAYVRALVQGGRVATLQGDLHGQVALRSAAEACKALKIPLRIFYTSNAEGFFPYSAAFRENLAAFPRDERSVMLRTYKHGFPRAAGDSWHYNLHQIDDFLARLALRDYGTIHRVMADLHASATPAVDRYGASYMDGSVPKHSTLAAALRR